MWSIRRMNQSPHAGFQADGDAHALLAGQLETLLNDVSWKNGFLHGLMMGDVQWRRSPAAVSAGIETEKTETC